ncbi:MAG TPA: glycosyltransferase family 2 protein [Dissulfurispiraceae bacterium]|nr:glycosyltransferase family 2 protein [Dissulfurispiraceae bacterium]
MIELVFWLSAALILYTYTGYPLLLMALAKLKKKPVMKSPIQPSVSVVLAVRNEADRIAARLRNICEQDYPAENMEIIVVSDGSDDGTDALAESFADRRVKLIRLAQSAGKAIAVNAGVAAAGGEIIVFADARQQFDPMVIRELAANFADPAVGCAGGELVFLNSPDSTVRVEMGAYWKYEKAVRRMESDTGSVIGASGCIYAIRRVLYKPLPAGTILDDVLTPMNIVRQGYRVVFDSSALAHDLVSKDAGQEWKRKVRTLTGNWQLLSLSPWLMVPGMNPAWVRFMSHKIFRVKVPFWLMCLLASSALLPATVYQGALFVQLGCYALAGAAALCPALQKTKGISFIYFFAVLNTAAVAGCWKWLSGNSAATWQAAYKGGSE